MAIPWQDDRLKRPRAGRTLREVETGVVAAAQAPVATGEGVSGPRSGGAPTNPTQLYGRTTGHYPITSSFFFQESL
jgi:hypothetical protein